MRYEAATFLLCRLRRTDTTLLVASYYIQLGGIEMVLLCIDDYIASSNLLFLNLTSKIVGMTMLSIPPPFRPPRIIISSREHPSCRLLPISVTNYDDQSKNDTYDDMLLS